MGLFTKKHHDEPQHGPGSSAFGHDSAAGTTTRDNYDAVGTTGGVTGAGTGATGHHGHHDHHDRHEDGQFREGHGSGLGTGTTHGGQRGTGMETYGNAPGVGAGQTNYEHGGTAAGAEHAGSGGGKAFAGKVEKGLGTMLGSESLKQKGLEKQREAEILREQAQHIEHAERLELEAKMHRDAAAKTHGGLPAGNNSTVPGEQMVNQPGMGGNPILPGGGMGHAFGGAI